MEIYPTGCRKYDRDVDTLPINQFIENKHKIPREFIAGLYIFNEGQSESINGIEMVSGFVEKFVPNSRFFGVLSSEEQVDFFETIKEKLVKEGLERANGDNDFHVALDLLLGQSTYYKDQLSAYRESNLKNK